MLGPLCPKVILSGARKSSLPTCLLAYLPAFNRMNLHELIASRGSCVSSIPHTVRPLCALIHSPLLSFNPQIRDRPRVEGGSTDPIAMNKAAAAIEITTLVPVMAAPATCVAAAWDAAAATGTAWTTWTEWATTLTASGTATTTNVSWRWSRPLHPSYPPRCTISKSVYGGNGTRPSFGSFIKAITAMQAPAWAGHAAAMTFDSWNSVTTIN